MLRNKNSALWATALSLGLFLACGGRSTAPGDASTGAAGSGAAGGAWVARAGAPGSAGVVTSAAGDTGEAGGAAGASGTSGTSDPGATGGVGVGGVSGAPGEAGAATAGESSAGSASAGAPNVPGGPVPSKGCGVALDGPAPLGNYAVRTVKVPGLDPVYLPGGTYYAHSGAFDYSSRPYAVRVPQVYKPNGNYPVTIAIPGCGGNAERFADAPTGTVNAQGAQVGIEVALSAIDGCFNDGGPAIGNRADSPEIPYFRAVLSAVEAEFCVDTSKVFVNGYNAGGFAAYTLGCAAADVVRGVTVFQGGMRAVRPKCLGPMAALLIAPTTLASMPLGPLDPNDPWYIKLGSPGSVPGRDDLLARNGCQGTATEPWSAAFPACVKYSGCPAAYPVVWCPIPTSNQTPCCIGNTNYEVTPEWPFLSSLK